MNESLLGNCNYNLNLEVENKIVLKTFRGQPRKYFKGDLKFWNYIGQTGSFCNQRMKDVSSEAAISFVFWKVLSCIFLMDWKRTGLTTLNTSTEMSPFCVIDRDISDQLAL